MTVIELSKMSGVTSDAIRYYTRLGLLKPSRNLVNNYKQYCSADVNCVRFIRRAKSLGFTLVEIAEIIKKSRQGKAPCRMVRETVRRRVEEKSRELEEMIAMHNRMKRALVQWEKLPDMIPDGHAMCKLIEMIGND